MAESHNLPLAEIFLLGLFGVVLTIGIIFRRLGVESFLGAPTIGICLGVAFSAIAVYGGASEHYQEYFAFNADLFLYALLPTIIIDASLNANSQLFLLNIGTILSMAVVGTTGAAFIISVMQWAFGQADIAFQMSYLHNLLLGAVISAVDPVTVLAVFQALEADGNLFINVFGESVLNDAVAEVLYITVSNFLPYEGHEPTPVNAREVWRAIGKFIGIFIGSVVMGLATGLVNAGIMRLGLFKSEGSAYETGIVVVFLYASYFAATVAHISGIVSVFFCGLIVRAYTWPNLTSEARLLIHSTFELLASLLDIFLFIYMGITIFTMEVFSVWRFSALCLISIAAGRLGGMIPCLGIPNLVRPAHRRMSWKVMFLSWWSGLRGAMAFALASLAADRFGKEGEVIKTTVFYVAFLTVVFNGGSIGWLLKTLKLTEADRLASLAMQSRQQHTEDSVHTGITPAPSAPEDYLHAPSLSHAASLQAPSLQAPSYCPWESRPHIISEDDPLPYKPWEDDQLAPLPAPPSPPVGKGRLYAQSTPVHDPRRALRPAPSTPLTFNIDARTLEEPSPQRATPTQQKRMSSLHAQSMPMHRVSRRALAAQSMPLNRASRQPQLFTDSVPVDNPRRMRVDYQRRQEQYQKAIHEEAQSAPEETVKQRRRNPLQWLQSKNLWFYDLMMWIDRKILSKLLIPPDAGLERVDSHGHPLPEEDAVDEENKGH